LLKLNPWEVIIDNQSPSPLPFVPMDMDVSFQCSLNILFILPCPFCNRGFEPTWDCKIIFCRHAYHSWCVIVHFSNSSKWLLKGCQEEMHGEWWGLSGITKLGNDDKRWTRIDWNRRTTLDNVQGEFIEASWILLRFSFILWLYSNVHEICVTCIKV
jgi:hypothetical protein